MNQSSCIIITFSFVVLKVWAKKCDFLKTYYLSKYFQKLCAHFLHAYTKSNLNLLKIKDLVIFKNNYTKIIQKAIIGKNYPQTLSLAKHLPQIKTRMTVN